MKYCEIAITSNKTIVDQDKHHLWLFTEDGAFCFDRQKATGKLVRAAYMPLQDAHEEFINQENVSVFYLRTHAQLFPKILLERYDLHSLYALQKDIPGRVQFKQEDLLGLDAVIVSYVPAQLFMLNAGATDYFFIWVKQIWHKYRVFSAERPLFFMFVFGEYLTALVLYQRKVQLFNHFYSQTLAEFYYQIQGILQACNLRVHDVLFYVAGDLSTFDERLLYLKEKASEIVMLHGFAPTNDKEVPFSSIYWAFKEI